MAARKNAASPVDDPVTKALALGSYFLSGCLAINVSQVLGTPLAWINSAWYNSWITFTKQQFAVLAMTLTRRWAPTVVRVSGDASVRGQLFQTTSNELLCLFPQRMVMIANHQIYTDWLYLWWIAYSNGMHGRIFIVLKESLKRIPVLGWGMQLYQFIFLKRNWAQDRSQLARHLRKLDHLDRPMWLLLFPEGTNLAPSTRDASTRWATRNGIPDLRHLLLPRTTGLQFCLQELRQTIAYVYDCTIAYEGVAPGQYAQDVYTLHAAYIAGKPPPCVHMYWRRFPLAQIPIGDDRRFELWLRARWMEKDSLLTYFHRHGKFPADTGSQEGADGRIQSGAGYIDATIQARKWNDFLHQLVPMGFLAMILMTFYGALPEIFQEAVKQHPLLQNIGELPQVKMQERNDAGSGSDQHSSMVAVVPGSKIKNVQAKPEQLVDTIKINRPNLVAKDPPPQIPAPPRAMQRIPAAKLAPIPPTGSINKLGRKGPAQSAPKPSTPTRSDCAATSVKSAASSVATANAVSNTVTRAQSVAAPVCVSKSANKRWAPKLAPRQSMPNLSRQMLSSTASVNSGPIATGVLPKLGPRKEPVLRSARKKLPRSAIAGDGIPLPTKNVRIAEDAAKLPIR